MRYLAISVLLIASSCALADKKTEYLLPEDWSSENSKPIEKTELDLTIKQYFSGMRKHIKEVPQCSGAIFGEAKSLNNGASVYQSISWDGPKVETVAHITSGKKLSSLRLAAPGLASDEMQMRAMMCATYALIRTLSPNYFDEAQSLDSAKYLFSNAKLKPSKLAVVDDVLNAKLTPFEVVATPQKMQ